MRKLTCKNGNIVYEKPDTDTSEGGVDINALVDDIF